MTLSALPRSVRRSAAAASLLAISYFASSALSAQTAAPQHPHPVATGVADASLKHPITDLHPLATLHLPLNPDWFTATEDAIWVTSSRSNVVTQILAKSNRIGLTVNVEKPCSGLSYGAGSIWIPSCGTRQLVRADAATGRVLATIDAAPADSEGGITSGAGSVWLVTSKDGVLTRIDTTTNHVTAAITIPSGSFNPLFADGYVWVSSNEHSVLVQVDPETNAVVKEIPTGKNPRFLTSGAGSVWTLNQGDGTITRIDTKTATKIATIEAGLEGFGGEISFGDGAVWATLFGFPITRVNASTNAVTAQWTGAGGDSIRAAYGSIWLTNYRTGEVWRLEPAP